MSNTNEADSAALADLAKKKAEIDRAVRTKFLATLFFGLVCVVGLAAAIWVIRSGLAGWVEAINNRRSLMDQVRAVYFGRVAADACLACTGGLVALIATLNVAVAAQQPPGDSVVAQLRDARWRYDLSNVARFAAALALVCGVASFTGKDRGESVGLCLFALVLALLGSYLAATVQNNAQSNAVRMLQQREVSGELAATNGRIQALAAGETVSLWRAAAGVAAQVAAVVTILFGLGLFLFYAAAGFTRLYALVGFALPSAVVGVAVSMLVFGGRVHLLETIDKASKFWLAVFVLFELALAGGFVAVAVSVWSTSGGWEKHAAAALGFFILVGVAPMWAWLMTARPAFSGQSRDEFGTFKRFVAALRDDISAPSRKIAVHVLEGKVGQLEDRADELFAN